MKYIKKFNESGENNPKDYNIEYKRLADELERFQVNYGVNVGNMKIDDFVSKSKSIKSGSGYNSN